MKSPPHVHVVILHRSGRELLEGSLKDVLGQQGCRVSVWVSDNGSTDGSVAWVETAYPEVSVLRNGENLGWSRGNNVGIRAALEAGADYVWILNNDVAMEPDCLVQLVEEMERRPEIGVVSPRIFFDHPRDRVWFEGGEFRPDELDGSHCSLAHFHTLDNRVRFVSGCAMLVRRSVFEAVGLIDERFFLYCEDVDFCWRVAGAGFGIDVIPSAILYHKVGSSSGGDQGSPLQTYHMLRSGLLFMRKSFGFVRFRIRFGTHQLGKWILPLSAMWADPARAGRADAIADALWYVARGYNCPLDWPPSPRWFKRLLQRRPWVFAAYWSLGATLLEDIGRKLNVKKGEG